MVGVRHHVSAGRGRQEAHSDVVMEAYQRTQVSVRNDHTLLHINFGEIK